MTSFIIIIGLFLFFAYWQHLEEAKTELKQLKKEKPPLVKPEYLWTESDLVPEELYEEEKALSPEEQEQRVKFRKYYNESVKRWAQADCVWIDELPKAVEPEPLALLKDKTPPRNEEDYMLIS